MSEIGVLCFLLTGAMTIAAYAQSSNNTEFGNRVLVISRENNSARPGQNVERPGRPGDKVLSDEAKKALEVASQARETFISEQKELALQAGEASKEARETLREQNREGLAELREQQKLQRQEAKERAKELKLALHPDLGRVVDLAIAEGRER